MGSFQPPVVLRKLIHPTLAKKGKLYVYYTTPAWNFHKGCDIWKEPNDLSLVIGKIPDESIVMFLSMTPENKFMRIVYGEVVGYTKGSLWTANRVTCWAKTT